MVIQNKPCRSSREQPIVARVSALTTGGISAVGACEYRDVPVFGPAGFRSLPTAGQRVLLIPVEGGYCCVGALPEPAASGEVELSNAGGALIRLKADGTIQLGNAVVTCGGDGSFALSGPGGASIRMDARGNVVINGTAFAPEGSA